MADITPKIPLTERAAKFLTSRESVFISHAQNAEDVILYRVFRDQHEGFYIDVGAHDPRAFSVTHALYRRGWRGINLEPNLYYFKKLQSQRPRDINLQIAASDHGGMVKFFESPRTGLSTTSHEFAKRARESGHRMNPTIVRCSTLNNVCSTYKINKIDFLNIDVEGGEEKVLRGLNLNDIRPIILIIEATEPCSTRANYTAWEPYVTAHNYEMVYDDGLNRFYLAQERIDLKHHFAYPPNVFDNYQVRLSYAQVHAQIFSPILKKMPPNLRHSLRILRRNLWQVR